MPEPKTFVSHCGISCVLHPSANINPPMGWSDSRSTQHFTGTYNTILKTINNHVVDHSLLAVSPLTSESSTLLMRNRKFCSDSVLDLLNNKPSTLCRYRL